MTVILHDARDAARRLDRGALVAIPTETVYGLAADARNPRAVSRVFEVKGRPSDHPVIVHVARCEDAAAWSTGIDPRLMDLMARYWPGPLTVVVPKAPWVSDLITGGQPTVALRVPAHDMARQVIEALGELQGQPAGVVAPSANLFGQVSPTTALHVESDLGAVLGEDDAILDGGPCAIGVESTVVAMVGDELRVLRPGGAPIDEHDVPAEGAVTVLPRVPGALPAHYSPRARVLVCEAGELGAHRRLLHGQKVALIAESDVVTPQGWHRVGAPPDDKAYARILYSSMRAADGLDAEVLVAIPPRTGALASAVLDRLVRAAAATLPSG